MKKLIITLILATVVGTTTTVVATQRDENGNIKNPIATFLTKSGTNELQDTVKPSEKNESPESVQVKTQESLEESKSDAKEDEPLSQVINQYISSVAYRAGKAINITSKNEIENAGVTSFQDKTGDLDLSAGSGIDIDGLEIKNSDKGSSQSIFKKIAVSGQDTIEANNNDSTLTFIAGTGITLSTDKDTKKLTITGSSSSIDADSLDFTSFKDSLTLDAATSIANAGYDFSVTGSGNTGIGLSSPAFTLDVGGKIGVNGSQVVYLPDQTNFLGTLIIGDSGTNLSHSSGSQGQLNTFVGIGSGAGNTTGASNTVLGYQSLYSNTTGNSNVAFGDRALYSNTTGNSNLALGQGALYFNSTGTGNSALGYTALNNNTTGNFATAVGYGALKANTTGSELTALGYNSLWKNTTGTGNAALGFGALLNNTVGSNNTAFGSRSIQFLTTGNNNIALGNLSGNNLTTGSSNIIIGYNIHMPSASSSNMINIGNLLYGTGVDGSTTTLSSGNIGIGTTNPNFKLEVAGNIGPNIDSTGSGIGYNLGSSGKRFDTVYASNGTINTSDVRLKTNISELNYGLNELMRLTPVSYNWKSSPDAVPKIGLIAQDVQLVIPEVVRVGDDENQTLGIFYSDLVPLAIKGIQEQQEQIVNLGGEVSSIGKKLDDNNLSLSIESSLINTATISGVLDANEVVVNGESTFVGIVSFIKDVTYNAVVQFKGKVDFFNTVVFHSDTSFIGNTKLSNAQIEEAMIENASIQLNKNQAGTAVIHSGIQNVDIRFGTPFDDKPQVQTTLVVTNGDDSLEEAILNSDFKYIISDISVDGFSIKINKKLDTDVEFSWLAFPTSGESSFESENTPDDAPNKQEEFTSASNSADISETIGDKQ